MFQLHLSHGFLEEPHTFTEKPETRLTQSTYTDASLTLCRAL